jgi:hypothetical protein
VIKKSALVAATLVLAAAGAQARDVFWSVGINAPIHPGVSIGSVISNAPVYHAGPAYYPPMPLAYPAPVYYQPVPILVRPVPLVYLPQPYYAPRRVVYATGWAPSHHGHGHARGHWRKHHGQRGPVMVSYGGR